MLTDEERQLVWGKRLGKMYHDEICPAYELFKQGKDRILMGILDQSESPDDIRDKLFTLINVTNRLAQNLEAILVPEYPEGERKGQANDTS